MISDELPPMYMTTEAIDNDDLVVNLCYWLMELDIIFALRKGVQH